MTTLTTFESKKAVRSFFTEEHHMFRESLRKFLEKEAIPYFDQWEEDRIIPRSFSNKLGEFGFLCPV